jgi:DNA-binding NarL/FixJ family response regulator
LWNPTGYEAQFELSLECHSRAERPFELARTQLCHGERLRRDKKRAAARPYLEQAGSTLQSLGAKIYAELARSELAAAGRTMADTDRPHHSALLTPQELQVAVSVAAGATNREAAAQLFLSPKTIEYHLARIFRKLQLTSRSDLKAALAAS